MISRHRILSLIVVFAICLLQTSCVTSPSRLSESVEKEIDIALVEASQSSTVVNVPEMVSQSLLPAMEFQLPAGDVEPLEPRFDLVANKTPAKTVFMSITRGTPYSMVVNPNTKGVISLQLKDVTVDEALEAIRQVYGYEYRRVGNRYMILGQGLQTRMFPVNYLNFNRKGKSDMRVSTGGLVSAEGGTSGVEGIRVETQSENDFWKDLREGLEGLIGTEEGQNIIVNPQAGLVIARAMPDELDLIEKFLGITQANVNRQVILEAKIIEVELNDTFQAGINWAGLDSSGNTSVLASQIGGGSLLNGGNTSGIAGQLTNLQPDASYTPNNPALASAFGGVFSVAVKAQDFAAFIELLKAQGDAQVLSSPRVSTVNNQKAVIKVGGDEFFVTGVTNQQSTTGATTTNIPEVELTPFFSGIALDVTPQIDDKDGIILHIHPTVSAVSQRDKSFVVGGESFSLPLAFSTVQESDSIVRAKSGQVIIIGGLMKEASTEDNASVPLLGDIPVLGNLFKHQKMTRIKKELVILVKPTIVDNGLAWDKDMLAVRDRTTSFKRTGFR